MAGQQRGWMDYPPRATVCFRTRARRQPFAYPASLIRKKLNVMWPLFQLFAAGLFLAAVTLHLVRRPLILLYLLLIVQFLVAGGLMPEISTRVMGVAIGPVDVINMMLLAAAILRMKCGPTGLQWALLGAMGLVIYGTFSGFLRLGDAAMLGFREELYFLVPALFVSTISMQSLPEVVRAIVWFGVGLAVLAVLRWIGIAPTPEWGFDHGYLIDRVIPSNAALWVALGALGAVYAVFDAHRQRFIAHPWIVAALCLAVVLFTQHRSVWVASAVMLTIVFLITQHRASIKVAVVLAAGITVALIELLDLGHGGAATESLARAASNVSTWEWRLEQWGAAWETHSARGWGAILLGSGYGFGWQTGIVGDWEVPPHNGYLQIAIRIGLLGAFLVFLPYYLALRQLLYTGDFTSRVLWLWTIGILIFYIPYSVNMLTGAIFGTMIAALHTRVVQWRPKPPPFSHAPAPDYRDCGDSRPSYPRPAVDRTRR